MAYQIEITPTAIETLKHIVDRRTRGAIMRRIDTLTEEPEKQGKALRGWLAGFMSTRAAGQRYRVVYKVDNGKKRVVIYIVAIRQEGNRHDVYALAERLVRKGFI